VAQRPSVRAYLTGGIGRHRDPLGRAISRRACRYSFGTTWRCNRETGGTTVLKDLFGDNSALPDHPVEWPLRTMAIRALGVFA
jgi:hypothetical protein